MRRIVQLSVGLLTAFFPLAAFAALPAPDSLIKGNSSTVYYYASDGKRYVFPNEKTYKSWFIDFSGVIKVSDSDLSSLPLGGNVTYRPGVRLVKIQTDPKVYAVDRGGTLRLLESESIADDLYGQYWNRAIDDIADPFFINYKIGEPIEEAEDFSPYETAESITTINADKGLPVGPLPQRAETEVANLIDEWRAFALADLNEHRRQNGKPPLTMDPLLNRIATIHSRDMAVNIGSISHEGSLGENSSDRMRLGKVPNVLNKTFMTVPHPSNIGWTGENVGFTTMKQQQGVQWAITRLHNAYMNEPPDEENHRTTMLSTFHPFSVVGIGPYLDKEGDLWLTEDFISIE